MIFSWFFPYADKQARRSGLQILDLPDVGFRDDASINRLFSFPNLILKNDGLMISYMIEMYNQFVL